MDAIERRDQVVIERLGPCRASELAAELAGHDLVVIDRTELAELDRASAGYRRLAALVEQPEG